MATHHSTKFGNQRHYGGGYIIFLVVEEQDSTYSLTSTIVM